MGYRKYKQLHREKKRGRFWRKSPTIPTNLQIMLLVLGVGGSVWFAWSTASITRMENAIGKRGLTAQGNVVARSVGWPVDFRAKPIINMVRVDYEFQDVNKQRIHGSQWVSPPVADNLLSGKIVDVLYFPESPGFNRLAESPRTNVPLGFLFAFFIGGLCVWGLIESWRRR